MAIDCLQASVNVVRSLPFVSPASQHACIMEAASRHHRSSRCRFSRIEKCHARVLSTFRASIQSSWNHWPAVSRNSHGWPRGQSVAVTRHRPKTFGCGGKSNAGACHSPTCSNAAKRASTRLSPAVATARASARILSRDRTPHGLNHLFQTIRRQGEGRVPGLAGETTKKTLFFFRPTPHSSRQVVHHACKPVAY